uniref:Zinc finger protein hangover n=1 Tax=Culex pipiens TaxID=7175 RepID=A0A8D8IJU4_CULPI
MVSKGCCRLCLAPKTECVEIWSNFGADRQKLEFKILDCVHIKVSKDDHLSPMICHACISYLNSWQSFKNRCDAAEQKQREVCIEDQSRKKGHCHQSSDPSENIIKEEPFDVENDNELDPSNFLMQGVNGGNDRLQNGSLSEGFTNASENDMDDERGDALNQLMFAACTVCDMSFSNRANARRHERNIHGLCQNPAYPLSSAQDPVTGENVESNNRQNESVLNSVVPAKSSSNALNDLRQRIRTKLRAHREAYDYKNPSKYRHLITPNKLSFIMRNLDFLQQAQTMKCNCCNRTYPSYKYFMGHMRKKYQHLPRNVCFKCLRQFGSKGQFIGHLKRKACINLYAICMADDTIPKDMPENASLGTEEIIPNKTHEQQQLTGQDEFGYELFDQDGNSSSSLRNPQNCPVCDKQYNNYYNVLRHMESKHPNQLPQIYQCTRCSEGFPRQSELRDHLNSAHGETIAPVANTQRILYSCRQCSNTYNSIDGLQEHIKTHNQNSENEECNKKTNPCTTPMLSEATEEPSVSDQPVVSRTLNCGLCDFALTSIEALRQHMSEIHGMDKKFFYCNLCPAKFMNNRGLRFHLFRSHGVRDESIPMTSNQSSTSLLKPIQQVPSMTLQVPSINLDEIGTKLNECKICHIVYKNIEQLSLHVQLVHPALDNKSPDGRKVRDPNDIWQPDQLPPSKMRRKQTANTAVQKSPPTCPHCLSTFASSNNLKRHIIEVHKLKPLLNSSVLKAKECGSVEMAEIVDAHVHGESTINYNGSEHQEQDYIKQEQEEHFDSNAVVEDDFIGDTEENECSNDAGEQYFCELCQVHFTSANALRQHVSEHFLNVGIEGQMPLQKDDNHGTSTDSRSSTNSSESSSTSENES